MTTRRLVLLALSLACIGLGGCASFRRQSDDVSVTLANLRPAESTAFESSVVLTVRVTNAGAEALHFSGSRHRLVVNGHALGVAVTPEPLELPGLTTATQEVTFNLSHLALIPLVGELRREPTALYEIESTFFGGGMLSRGMLASHTGRIDLSGLAQTPLAGASR
jgi:hypothetical protein